DYQVREQCPNCTFVNGQFAEECEICNVGKMEEDPEEQEWQAHFAALIDFREKDGQWADQLGVLGVQQMWADQDSGPEPLPFQLPATPAPAPASTIAPIPAPAPVRGGTGTEGSDSDTGADYSTITPAPLPPQRRGRRPSIRSAGTERGTGPFEHLLIERAQAEAEAEAEVEAQEVPTSGFSAVYISAEVQVRQVKPGRLGRQGRHEAEVQGLLQERQEQETPKRRKRQHISDHKQDEHEGRGARDAGEGAETEVGVGEAGGAGEAGTGKGSEAIVLDADAEPALLNIVAFAYPEDDQAHLGIGLGDTDAGGVNDVVMLLPSDPNSPLYCDYHVESSWNVVDRNFLWSGLGLVQGEDDKYYLTKPARETLVKLRRRFGLLM
ncbi:hypothetical protein B484DRAFT_400320, partial [Ochromonadaceae sp. CCMP2298]